MGLMKSWLVGRNRVKDSCEVKRRRLRPRRDEVRGKDAKMKQMSPEWTVEMPSHREVGIRSAHAQPIIAQVYVTYRQRVSMKKSWKYRKQPKISLTSIFRACMHPDIHTKCCQLALSHSNIWAVWNDLLRCKLSFLPCQSIYTTASFSSDCRSPFAHGRPPQIFQLFQISTCWNAALCHSQKPTWQISGK